MKKYMVCLFLFAAVSAACLTAGVFFTKSRDEKNATTAPAVQSESAAVVEDRIASNQEKVSHETKAQEEYYLVSEDGFLLVFLKDRKTICLYTHIPLLDFPEKEQERLREGIWFSSMIEVFNYLESYTS